MNNGTALLNNYSAIWILELIQCAASWCVFRYRYVFISTLSNNLYGSCHSVSSEVHYAPLTSELYLCSISNKHPQLSIWNKTYKTRYCMWCETKFQLCNSGNLVEWDRLTLYITLHYILMMNWFVTRKYWRLTQK